MQKSKLNQHIRFVIVLLFTLNMLACKSDNNPIFKSDRFNIYPNRVEQGEFLAIAKNKKEINSSYPHLKSNQWKLKRSLFHYPSYQSNHEILNAIYNLSLEEIDRKILNDSIFSKENITSTTLGYSGMLSLALLHPKVCQNSLMQRVKNDRIIQDAGTGGSWPISSDRLIWGTAAWEIYKTTGDIDWLRRTYFIIKNSIDDDINSIWDYHSHLFKGEASFLNQQEQSYPKWMSPTNIYETYSLSNQVVHYKALQILIEMGNLLGKDIQKYKHISEALKKSINNKFKIEDKKYLGQFRYNNYNLVSPHSDALGESLANIWDARENSAENIPIHQFGVACFHPQIPNVANYHNNRIWPFIQATWNWAAAENKNTKAVLWGLASSIRSTALFLTNKRSYSIENGDFQPTENHSNDQLLSASSAISNFLHVLMGIHLTAEELEFKPVIPREFKGKQVLSNFRYNKAILHIEVLGFGNRISSFTFDGTPYKRAVVPKNIEGHHKIVIKMNNEIPIDEKINMVEHFYSPETPSLSYKNNQLQWNEINNATHYKVYKNGELLLETKDTHMVEVNFTYPTEFCVQSVDSLNHHSFLSKPVLLYERRYEKLIEAEIFLSKRKSSFVTLKKTDKEPYYFQVIAPRDGSYKLSFLYANGNGDVNTGDKCASRSLWQNNGYIGTIVFPQRGKGKWNDYNYSNSFHVDLKKGYNFFKISFEEFNNNMNGERNDVRIDKIRLLRLD
ncbi:hypothetical protein [Marinifilum fragile]|uniref:alpha-L-rhamnosidase-related protein n=1 Tax=Marinifilum fragile TaxID=570161 RepID=UPI002AA6AFAC|nr:hypothetical protein [Marinifilum fragile]